MAFKKLDDYPTDFRAADENGRVHVVECYRKDIRALMDVLLESHGDDFSTCLDEAQGGADEKPHYVILKVNPGAL